jgi:hypothetical protein
MREALRSTDSKSPKHEEKGRTTYLDLGFLHCEGSNVSRPQETVGTRLMILPMLMDDSKVINRASSQDFREVIVLDSYRAIGIIGSAG